MKKEEDEIDDIIKEYDDDLDLSGIIPSYDMIEINRPAFRLMNQYCEQLGLDHWIKLPKSIRDKCFDAVYNEKTPNGGDSSEIFYFDDKGNIVESDKATRCVIRELDENGEFD